MRKGVCSVACVHKRILTKYYNLYVIIIFKNIESSRDYYIYCFSRGCDIFNEDFIRDVCLLLLYVCVIVGSGNVVNVTPLVHHLQHNPPLDFGGNVPPTTYRNKCSRKFI